MDSLLKNKYLNMLEEYLPFKYRNTKYSILTVSLAKYNTLYFNNLINFDDEYFKNEFYFSQL